MLCFQVQDSHAKSKVTFMKVGGMAPAAGATAYAPFDYIGDAFRGTRGIMLDMYRIPEKLLALMDKVAEIIIRGAISSTKRTGVSIVLMPIHKGLDTFMSPDQFNTFFWPPLNKIILTLIDEKLTPCVFWEGDCTSRLEVIKDIPEGKAIYYFENTNIFEAKKILGEVVCIRGNVPASLLCTGRPRDVKEYCKKLIKIVAKDGGFILDGSAGIPDEAKAENVMAMSDAVKLYGTY